MNAPESDRTFVPKQALQPTPQLYDLLVGDSMENLAIASLDQIPTIPSESLLHDNGCGTGAATKAIVQAVSSGVNISIKASDINDKALDIYRASAIKEGWPADASHQDSLKLGFADGTFSHSILNALLFVLPEDGVGAISEAYRTLKPGGVLLTNSWHHVPNMEPIQTAAKLTRPEGTPLPRQGMQKWESAEFLQNIVEKGGFPKSQIKIVQKDTYSTTTELTHFANMLWSFIGGTGTAGWLESDEQNWDKAIDIIKEELRKSPGFQELEGGAAKLRFVANIAIATK